MEEEPKRERTRYPAGLLNYAAIIKKAEEIRDRDGAKQEEAPSQERRDNEEGPASEE